jgi:HlyD family secretion protein
MPANIRSTASKRRWVIGVIIGLAVVGLFYAQRLPSQEWFGHAKHQPAQLLLSGNIEAHESVLSFKTVQSRLIELPFNEGQWVSKGAVLAVVDSADYRQQQSIAEANLAIQLRQVELARQSFITASQTLLVDQAELNQRQQDWQRAAELQQQGFFSTAMLEQSSTALKQARAVLERDQSVQTAAKRNIEVTQASAHNSEASAALARLVVDYTILKAPFDGVVTVRKAELGEVVVPGTPVLTLADLDHVWLRAYLNESDLGRVRLGQMVTVSNDSHPNKRYEGRIAFIADKAEFTPKSVETHAERVTLVYRVKIDIVNTDHALVIGMPADAQVTLQAAGT